MTNLTFAQESDSKRYLNGVYIGVNSENFSDLGYQIYYEGKVNIFGEFSLIGSVGYSKIIEKTHYEIFGYSFINIQMDDGSVFSGYGAGRTVYDKIIYDILPISLGASYSVYKSKTHLIEISASGYYNIIEANPNVAESHNWIYYNEDEIPSEFKNTTVIEYPDNSFGLGLGISYGFFLNKNVPLKLCYQYVIDNEIINTHKISIGIQF